MTKLILLNKKKEERNYTRKFRFSSTTWKLKIFHSYIYIYLYNAQNMSLNERISSQLKSERGEGILSMHEKFSFFGSISRCFMPRLRDQTAKQHGVSAMRLLPASDSGQGRTTRGGGARRWAKVLPTLNSGGGVARKEDDSRNSGVE